jgi:hypothetical protein
MKQIVTGTRRATSGCGQVAANHPYDNMAATWKQGISVSFTVWIDFNR